MIPDCSAKVHVASCSTTALMSYWSRRGWLGICTTSNDIWWRDLCSLGASSQLQKHILYAFLPLLHLLHTLEPSHHTSILRADLFGFFSSLRLDILPWGGREQSRTIESF